MTPLTSVPPGLSAPIARKIKEVRQKTKKKMKSAKRTKHTLTAVLLVFAILTLSLSFSGCDRKALFAPLWKEEPDAPPEDSDDTLADVTPPEEEPPAPVFYNQLTGLVCDEELSSYRPISVCVGNFDGTVQEGLSQADVLIEAPIEGSATRMWAIYGTPTLVSKISSVRSVRDYMMPLARSFGAITAYAGTGDGVGVQALPFSGETLDYVNQNLSSSFFGSGNSIFTNGNALVSSASTMGYATKGTATLPYRLAEPDKALPSVGNRISSVSFAFSTGNVVSFSYDEATSLYSRSQLGEAHMDAGSGEQLAFQNVLLLFHNVNSYQSAEGTSFSLDTDAGGEGFCYTGGGTMRVVWRKDQSGNISFYDTNGDILTLNRGKTYIGMLRITDSSSIIAR